MSKLSEIEPEITFSKEFDNSRIIQFSLPSSLNLETRIRKLKLEEIEEISRDLKIFQYKTNFDNSNEKSIKLTSIIPDIPKSLVRTTDVRIAIIDTGVSKEFYEKYKAKISKYRDFTSESDGNPSYDDQGHGTLIASMFLSQSPDCSGIMSDSSIYIYKVFSSISDSRVSNLILALQQVIADSIDIVNLSLGAIESHDKNIELQLNELQSKGITIIAAAGNDGPLFGSINFPANIQNVIAVGGVDIKNELSPLSSKGGIELDRFGGALAIKPDFAALSKNIAGLSRDGITCTQSSGTSLAAPLVTIAVAFIKAQLKKSSIYQNTTLNENCLILQILSKSTDNNIELSVFEIGNGILNFTKLFQVLEDSSSSLIQLKSFIFPTFLDLTFNNTKFYPLSLVKLYPTRLPLNFQISICSSEKNIDKPLPILENGIGIQFIYERLNHNFHSMDLEISIYNSSLNRFEIFQKTINFANFSFNLTLQIEQIPPKSKRLLFDRFHSLTAPKHPVLRDSLSSYDYFYDLFGDSLYTNFITLHSVLISNGFYVESLYENYNCFNSNYYSVLIIIDPEANFSEEEKIKLENDVLRNSLSLMILGDWDTANMENNEICAESRNRLNNTVCMPGSNIGSLNFLLKDFGIGLGQESYSGELSVLGSQFDYLSGTYIVKFPREGFLFTFDVTKDNEVLQNPKFRSSQSLNLPILGLLKSVYGYSGAGSVAVFGDTSCLDSSSMLSPCFDLIMELFAFLRNGESKLFSEFTNFELKTNFEREVPKIKTHSNSNTDESQAISCKRINFGTENLIKLQDFIPTQNLNNSDKISEWMSIRKVSFSFKNYLASLISNKFATLIIITGIILIPLSVLLFILLKRRRKRNLLSYENIIIEL